MNVIYISLIMRTRLLNFIINYNNKGEIIMDFKLNYETILKLTNNEIMDLFEQLTNFNLFSMNISWRKSKEYILS